MCFELHAFLRAVRFYEFFNLSHLSNLKTARSAFEKPGRLEASNSMFRAGLSPCPGAAELTRPACYSTSVMRRIWTWTFDLPPDELWPLLADTNRFNEAMGLPSYVLEETPQANGTILRRGRARRRASPSNGRRSPTSGSTAATSARPASSPRALFAASGRCSISSRSTSGAAPSAQGELRPRLGAAHLHGPPVRRPAGAAGRRDRGQAHP